MIVPNLLTFYFRLQFVIKSLKLKRILLYKIKRQKNLNYDKVLIFIKVFIIVSNFLLSNVFIK